MDEKLSYNRVQLLGAASLVSLSPILRLFPLASVRPAGSAIWLSVILAFPVLLLYMSLLNSILRRAGGKGLDALCMDICGKTAGRIILILFALWFMLYAGFTLRSGADRLVTTVYLKSPAAFFSVTMGIACIIGSLFPIRSLLRFARLVIPLVFGILLIVLGIGLVSVEPSNLLPITHHDILPAVEGTVPIIDVLVLSVYLYCFFENSACSAPGRKRALFLWAGRECGLLLLLCVCIVGCFGAGLTSRLSKPFFSFIRNLVFFRSVERIEAFVLMLWVFPDFLLVCLLLSGSARCLRVALGREAVVQKSSLFDMSGLSWLILPLGVGAVLISLLIGQSMTGLSLWSELIIPGVNLFFAFFLVPLIAIIARLKA